MCFGAIIRTNLNLAAGNIRAVFGSEILGFGFGILVTGLDLGFSLTWPIQSVI